MCLTFTVTVITSRILTESVTIMFILTLHLPSKHLSPQAPSDPIPHHYSDTVSHLLNFFFGLHHVPESKLQCV